MPKPSWLQRLQERRQEKQYDKAYRNALSNEIVMQHYAENRWQYPPGARPQPLERAFLEKHGLQSRARPSDRERGRGSEDSGRSTR
ncbi:MAG: hypothetical protein GEV07_13120 [Streptosporangiales bacterium]|nr:hypothetical protein [Streptosporangiales bacterium]